MDGKIQNFYDLKVWKDGHNLAIDIYAITEKYPNKEQFSLVSQLRRAASSVTANIAEGFGRYHFKDKIKFYQQARGSAVEVLDHLFLSRDIGYCAKEDFDRLFILTNLVSKEINGLIRSANTQIDKY